MAALEEKMYRVLRAQGLTQLEFLALMDSYVPWSQHLPDFDKASFPIALDTGGVAYMYGASTDDVYLIDKQGRLVTMSPDFHDPKVDLLNKRIRSLHAE